MSWEITAKGAYVRHFRFGEWIGAPLTPLSESWLVTDLEEWCHRRVKQLWGMDPPRPLHVIVNGWYFYGGLNIDITNPWVWLRALPTLLWNLPRHFREIASTSAKPLGFRHEWKRWRNELLPPYRAEVERARARVGVAGPEESLDLVQALVDAAAAQFTSIIGVSGYGATIEFDLRVFLGKHAPAHRWRVHELIGRIGTPPAEHDVEGLDWVFPTAGERGPLPPGPSPEACAEIDARRARAESDIRAALPPKLVQKFEHLLREMRDGHTACQEQSPLATLAWPTMRALLLGVGERLAAAGVIRSAEDVFFLTRSELQAAVRGERVEADTGARRTTWERQRKLAPPLMLGEKTGIYKMVWDQVEAMNAHDDRLDPNVLGGCPSAPGQVTAVARVIRGLDELDRLQPGEILVAPVTTPAWTAAFGKAAGVVTDAGSFCSHASIVAREHGIPAVVATAHGTTRIRDGQRITLDGSTGIVRLST